jgi:hypothetical protein
MRDFLLQYTFDLIVMIIAVTWHVLFLIAMGFAMSVIIAYKIAALDTDANGGNIDINAGWKLLLFGMFYGTVDYLAGVALEYTQTLIIQMIGYNGKEGPTRSSTKSFSIPTAGGTTTTTTTISNQVEFDKNFLALNEIANNWNIFYIAQRAMQVVTPYIFIGFIEAAVLFVFITCL